MKDAPLQVRLEATTRKELKARAARTGIYESTLARFAIEEVLKRYRTSASLLEAYLRSRVGATVAPAEAKKAA